MTLDETGQIMSAIKAAYPNFYKSSTTAEMETAVKLWQYQFSGDDFKLVQVAVLKLISEFKFPPTVADVRERINEIITPDENIGIILWNELKKAASNSKYCSKEEFEKLNPILKKIVGSHENLQELGMLERDIFNTVTKGQMMKSIEIEMRRERDIKTMPPSIKQMIDNVKQKAMMLDCD